MRIIYEDDENYSIETYINGDLTTVEVHDLLTHQYARAHSLRSQEDIYNEVVGQGIARYRAFQRLLRKNEKSLIKSLG